jgi:hypothetical protein
MQYNELLDTFYNGLTAVSRSYIDSIAGNIFRNMKIKAKGLLDMMAQNYDNWILNEEDNILKKSGILNLPDESYKEALIATKKKLNLLIY